MVVALQGVSDVAVATYTTSRSLWGQCVSPLRKVHAPWGMQCPPLLARRRGGHTRGPGMQKGSPEGLTAAGDLVHHLWSAVYRGRFARGCKGRQTGQLPRPHTSRDSRCGCALEGYYYSWAMAFGPPATQPVVFAQLVPHLLSVKMEGDSCHLVCCGHIVLVATTYPSMHGCFGIAQPMSSMCLHGPHQLSS